ncbi:hypothetical protein C6383_22930 [Pseudomonas syringae pv. actinidiae]|nr:hypothetical protein BUE61_28100 [Pseudomonas syringae pv. actinidiae]PBK52013.1 hypothetical protein BUE60_17345 [Pseudomonas syringae pv. actinidiae]RJX56059.1 hypothetical protein C6383_22930 [Pseudomonas syringae pv. actinidiae]RJX57627.1 hypothetical protein C6379_10535 [Pseudomonas syringae pv. actinidiae]RJY21330.1 hypothetical protein C6381_18185 [Pseudomonas syringae pv. actinidiae]
MRVFEGMYIKQVRISGAAYLRCRLIATEQKLRTPHLSGITSPCPAIPAMLMNRALAAMQEKQISGA